MRITTVAEGAERDALRSPDASSDVATPGVLVLDARHRITLRSGAAREQLADLCAAGATHIGGAPGEALPCAVVSLLTQIAAARGRSAEPLAAGLPVGGPPVAELRAQGRSQRWYTLRATVAEPDTAGDCATVIVIEPRSSRDVALLLSRMYGLTPREREVVVHVLRGEPTKRIAAGLALSAHTVQDHIDHACDKLGVRGRRALLAKLFTDGYATALLGQE